MRPSRYVQNFRGSRALICAAPGPSAGTLAMVLPKLALTPELLCCQPGQLIALPAVQPGDILFLDGDLVLPGGWADPDGHDCAAPCPVVGLVGSEAPSRLRALAQLGARAFLSKPVHGGSVYSALFLAVNEFNHIGQIQAALDDLNDRRRKRAHVLRAVVRLVQREALDSDAAYDRLRREAMRARLSIESYCQSLPEAGNDEDSDENQQRRQA